MNDNKMIELDDSTNHSDTARAPPVGQMLICSFSVRKHRLISYVATRYPDCHRKLSRSSLVVRIMGVSEQLVKSSTAVQLSMKLAIGCCRV